MAQPKRTKTTGTWDDSAALLRIVAHPLRLRILSELADGARCVMDLNELVPVSQPILSQHMAALRKAGLVANYARGPLRCYYLVRPELVVSLLEALSGSPQAHTRPRDEVLTEVDDASARLRRTRTSRGRTRTTRRRSNP